MKRLLLTGCLLALGVWTRAYAQDVTFGGQLRPRFEFRDPVTAGDDGFTSMRIRANISAALERNVRVFIQLQDVRLFGEETNTLSDFRADNFDVHQGYVELQHSGASGLSARIGRQEVNLADQRLVGAVGWEQQGRAFDGVRVRADFSRGTVDFFGFKTGEATAVSVVDDAEFVGAHARLTEIVGGTLDVFGYFNRALATSIRPDIDTKEGTFGVRLAGRQSRVRFRAEGAYQLGERNGVDVAAFMVAGSVGAQVTDRVSITGWYDYLSGDGDLTDGTTRVFNTLFATNHLYYGLADVFLNIPAHTGARGLQDIAVKGAFTPRDDVFVGVDVHEFLVARQGTLTSPRLGEEIDLTVRHRYSPNLSVQAGFSYIVQGDAFAELGRLTEDMVWSYLMLNATF